ncbi:LTA synthase family protein [Ruminiclostridium cellobioparum]|uniref:Sulfatase n=1 Tax=Ruminiclostridium cellobioparum subsp. termitidis CT1112 TaxID=1195236 RepID=S0FPJ3_RUMCE|nr:LTA synthase family protein [Ruminiclostridium cellobioparum]EMS70373.1 sulfatase [Ruminiclostridium cellobioparum subsp. termitidis CT1112]
MKKINKGILALIVAVAISAIDIFYNGNGYSQLLLALAASFAVFNMPAIPDKLNKLPYSKLILFILNIVLLVFTFKHKVLLVNMLLLSYLIWSAVTPFFQKFKSFLPVTFLMCFVAVYAASFLGFSVPLFIFVFYPVYALGVLTHEKNIIKTPKIWLFAFLNLAGAAVLLVLFMYKALGQSVLSSILFTNITKLGTVTAVYLPFIGLFMAWFAASGNLIFHMLTSGFEKGNTAFDLSDYFKPVFSFISFFVFVTVITFLCEYSIRQEIKATITDMLHPNIMFNILVLCSLYMCLISLFGKGISNVLLSIVAIFLTIANFIKFTYFDEPFYPWDLYMFKNLIGICKDYLNIPIVIAVLVILAGLIFLLVKFRKNVLSYLKPGFNFVIMPFALILFLLNANVLADYRLSVQVGVQRSWYIGKAEILANGMYAQNYYYLTDLEKYLNPKPDDYSEETMQAISDKYPASVDNSVTASTVGGAVKSAEKPNVIAIMSESYWDLTKLNGLSFSKDVAENVHKYQRGMLAPPAIGGGTANTEFEALTGMSLYFMSPGIIAYNAYLRTETPSIASVFKDNGYSTTAIHPNGGWFYNRDKVYNYFGFEKFYDVSSFDMNTQTKGPHISDYALVDKILETLNSSDKPAFIFAVSMENHDPFDNKYSSFDVNVESDQLNSSQKSIINGYAQGLYDADQSLGKLIEELKKSDKPTLLYFFGDHAPRLGTLDDYYSVYDKLGAKQDSELKQGIGELKYYTTPLVTWSNFREMRSFSSIISPSHLSYEILKDAGVDHPNYFNIMPQLEEKYPIMHLKNMGLVDPDDELVKDYRLIQYDLLFGNKYLKSGN